MSVQYLRRLEVAELLGVPERTVKDWVTRRSIPHRKIPGVKAVLFLEPELHVWIDDPLVQLEVKVGKDGARVVKPRTVA